MTPDSDERPATPPAGRHIETLRTSQIEARSVLDQQLSTLSDIDEKALRTVRIALLLLGIVLSATAFPDRAVFVIWLTIPGIVSISVSILFGLLTYTSPDPTVGPSTDFFEDVRVEPYSEAEWRTLLISGYVEWIGDVEELNSSNARTLIFSQLSLGIGVAFLTTGTILSILA